MKLGYQVNQNGQLDTRTKKAIEAFEKKQQLLITGEVDETLLNSLQKAYSRADDKAWKKAKRQHSVAGYKAYQSQFPQGQYVSQVAGQQQQARADKAAADKLAQQQAAADPRRPESRPTRQRRGRRR